MAVEVKVSVANDVKREYPYLGRHTEGAVVLFVSRLRGMCVCDGPTNKAGEIANDWIERDFTPLSPSESITLSNKA